jgi:5-methylcytosine-specific restriction endonuclease McrA
MAFRINELWGFEVRKNPLTSGDSSVTIVIEGKGVLMTGPAYIDAIMASDSYKKLQEEKYERARQWRGSTLKERLMLKQWAIEQCGGKCLLCGYFRCYRALEFHHRERRKKEFGISEGILKKVRFRTIEECKSLLSEELTKCVILCANCHREVEAGYASVPRGA